MAAVAAAAVCCGCAGGQGGTSTGTPGTGTGAGTAATGTTATGTAATGAAAVATPGTSSSPAPAGPSQSAADAARDHVPSQVAALPLAARLIPAPSPDPGLATGVTTPEGVWLISRPDLGTVTASGCLPADPAAGIGYRTCSDYSEVLLVSPDRSRILRAVPVPAAPPQWLVAGGGAVYAGRQGDGGAPDSMVLRIDPGTGRVVGRIFPAQDAPDPGLTAADVGSWPEGWALGRPQPAVFDQATLSDGVLVLTGSADGRLRLDPVTLTPRR